MLEATAIKKVLKQLKDSCPDASTALDHRNPFQLLIATILSAQCTDKRVNIVTPALFRDLPTPKAIVKAGEAKLTPYIKTCGLYKSKARNIVKCCGQLIREFDSKVPQTIKELQSLAGVGKKTANVVASVAFEVPAIAVDTHVFRVSNRIGLAKAKDVKKTEAQLNEAIPKKDWRHAHHWLIYHGRNVCQARNPKCETCPVKKWCLYYKALTGKNIQSNKP